MFKHLTVNQVYIPLARSSGKIFELTQAQKLQSDAKWKRLHQFLADIGVKALRTHLGQIIVVNGGHRDFVFATRNRSLQLRYLVRLSVKELVLENFAGLPADQLLERMIELSPYAGEKLRSG
jgi:hypothetical protein